MTLSSELQTIQLCQRVLVVFTACCYASAVNAVVVRPSFCPSVTSRHSIKTAECSVTKTTLCDIPGTRFLMLKIYAKFQLQVTPNGGAK